MSETQDQKDLKTFIPEGQKIKIADKEFEIKPLVLGERTKVVSVLTAAVQEAAKGPDIENKTALGLAIISKAGDKIIEFYQIVLGEDEEWLNANMTMRDELLTIKTVMEVNGINFLLQEAQKILGKSIKEEKKQA